MVRLAGCLVFVIGMFAGLIAFSMFFADGDKSLRSVAIFFGVLSAVLLLVGSRWLSGRKKSSWRDDPATDRQREFARELGIKIPRNATKGEASDLISEVTGE